MEALQAGGGVVQVLRIALIDAQRCEFEHAVFNLLE